MAFRGERFVVDLDDDVDDSVNPPVDPSPPPLLGLIGEIHERAPSTAAPPAPKPPSGVGFPQHRRRVKQSTFKQRRGNQPESSASPSTSTNPISSTPFDEKKAIDEENRRQLASMSESQIQQEREELMSSMGSSLLEKFLRRANIDSDSSKDEPQQSTAQPAEDEGRPQKPKKSVFFDVPKASTTPAQATSSPSPQFNEDLPPAQLPDDLHPASELPAPDSFHFPTPPRQNPVPNLDPSSPSFLSDLQTHYFPDMPHDPSALSWLQPPSSDPEDPESASPYHPASEAASVSPSAIRFSLVGTMLSPSTSLSLPTNLGLHHHGKDPQAAGYTIPELSILARSTFPAQRCIAWQVLGRILFRLGKGEFGERGSTLAEGLWFVIEKEKVLVEMLAEADGQHPGPSRERNAGGNVDKPQGGVPGGFGRHASATAWATEGVWLWQLGGGGDRGLLKEGVHRSQ